MREYIGYAAVALITLFMTGYSVHMVLGGTVSETTEKEIIAVVLAALAAVLAFMARDLIKRKKGQ